MKIIILIAIFGCSAAVSAQSLHSDADQRASTLIKTYCVSCHNETLRTANLLLDQAIGNPVGEKPAAWEKVVRRLRARSMPPQVMPRPNDEDYQFLVGYLESELDRNAAANHNPGRTVPHRLNRTEYANAVRDIFGLDFNIANLLPPDPASGFGFDNMADVLTLSPSLMEQYISAAKTISLLAIGNPNQRPVVETFILPDKIDQLDRASEDLPFASRGGAAINHYFPVDGEYVIRVNLASIPVGIYTGRIVGFIIPKQLEIRLDGEKLKQFQVGGEQETGSTIEVRIPVKAGMRSIGVSFHRDRSKTEVIAKERLDGSYDEGKVTMVEVEGPYSSSGLGKTPSRQKIYSCRPNNSNEEPGCAKQILSKLAYSAYRRPVTDQEIESVLTVYQSGRKRGEDFDAAIGSAIQGILISPKFLFRTEREPANSKPGEVYLISDLELASRLSFFLWRSVPDETLINLAEQGRLRAPDILEQQISRMLKDPRSSSMVEDFAYQWLHVRNLDLLSPPNQEFFPDYNDNLKSAFKKEIELLVDYVVREDRSILDFLNADYSFLNEQLARHYGIAGVYGSHFRLVSLADENRWGILGKGAVLTVTSYATRTSPTLRGKWVLETILGTPPPPPPPDIPSLREDSTTQKLSMKERMELHRTNPVCASCHTLMDPLGLALENYDGIGSFRKVNLDGTPIDATGVLPNGTEFDGPAQLREALWLGREQFVGTFIESMLTYGLGRGLEYYDMPTVRKIMQQTAGQDFRWSSIIIEIIKSQPFLMRRSAGHDDI